MNIVKFIVNLWLRRAIYFANEAQLKSRSICLANVTKIDEKGRVQLAPYGDFLNVDGQGNRVIQRFQKDDANNIVNDFNKLTKTPTRLLGLPWYIGHPDHPRFRNVHTDSRAYMRVKSLEAGDDGLYGAVHFGSAGKALLDEEAFHGHSVNWRCVPDGRDRGLPVFRPVALKSVGFTNDPVIPVLPASLANEDLFNDDESSEGDPPSKAGVIIPTRLKLIAGFSADDDVTMDQIIAALEKAHPQLPNKPKTMANEKKVDLKIGDQNFPILLANEADNGDGLQKAINNLAESAEKATKANQDLANSFKAERKARATMIVNQLVKEGKIVKSEETAKIEELANAEDFDATSADWAKKAPVVKTQSRTTNLSSKHELVNHDAASRQKKIQNLVNERMAKFPDEGYSASFDAVMQSDEGQALFAQMQRPEPLEAR